MRPSLFAARTGAHPPVRNVLVLGGTGFVGRALCELLVERSGGGSGCITVPTRQIGRGRAVQFLPSVLVVEADLHDDAQLARLVAGQDAVVNLVAVLHGSEATFQRVHVDMPWRLARACHTAGVRRLVHVGALGTSAETATTAPSRYLRSKGAGEAALRNTQADASLDLTVLRPSAIFGAEDRFLNLFARLQSIFPLLPLAGADARFQPVWVMDVARAISRCLDDASTIGQVIECAGPREYTLVELVRLAGRLAGHERPVLSLPTWLGRLQAGLVELAPGDPLVSRDNLDSMRIPNVAGGTLPQLQRLGIAPASIESMAPLYLAPNPGRARLDAWRAHARR